MTDSIKISLDTEGTESLIEKNTDLERELARVYKELDTHDDDRRFVNWLAFASVSINLWLLIGWAFGAVTR